MHRMKRTAVHVQCVRMTTLYACIHVGKYTSCTIPGPAATRMPCTIKICSGVLSFVTLLWVALFELDTKMSTPSQDKPDLSQQTTSVSGGSVNSGQTVKVDQSQSVKEVSKTSQDPQSATQEHVGQDKLKRKTVSGGSVNSGQTVKVDQSQSVKEVSKTSQDPQSATQEHVGQDKLDTKTVCGGSVYIGKDETVDPSKTSQPATQVPVPNFVQTISSVSGGSVNSGQTIKVDHSQRVEGIVAIAHQK